MSLLNSLPHKIDHYSRSAIRDSSAGPTLQSLPTPTNANVSCWVQPVTSDIKLQYNQRNVTVTKSVFLTDEAVFHAIKTDDRIVYEGHYYLKKGDADLSHLGRVFRIDLVNEQGGK